MLHLSWEGGAEGGGGEGGGGGGRGVHGVRRGGGRSRGRGNWGTDVTGDGVGWGLTPAPSGKLTKQHAQQS